VGVLAAVGQVERRVACCGEHLVFHRWFRAEHSRGGRGGGWRRTGRVAYLAATVSAMAGGLGLDAAGLSLPYCLHGAGSGIGRGAGRHLAALAGGGARVDGRDEFLPHHSDWRAAGRRVRLARSCAAGVAGTLGLARGESGSGCSVGLWHLPLFYLVGTVQSHLPMGLYAASAIASSVLFAWLYNRTQGSVWPVLILHAAVNAWSSVIPVMAMRDDSNLRAFQLVVGILVVSGLALLGRTDAAPRRDAAPVQP